MTGLEQLQIHIKKTIDRSQFEYLKKMSILKRNNNLLTDLFTEPLK